MKKLNYGCGTDYKPGWVNVDTNTRVKKDILIRAHPKHKLPFSNNEFDHIHTEFVFEHIEHNLHLLISEFHKILKPGGTLRIIVPHFTSMFSKYLDHHRMFGINSFCEFDIDDNSQLNDYPKFKMLSQKLSLIHHNTRGSKIKSLRILNIFNPLFNFNTYWQQAMERLNIFGFDEVSFLLKKPNF